MGIDEVGIDKVGIDEVGITLWCRLICRNSVELNFVKTG